MRWEEHHYHRDQHSKNELIKKVKKCHSRSSGGINIQVKAVNHSNLPILEPEGRIDSSSVGVMDEAFRQAFSAGSIALLIDMSKVEYISSGGLRSFLLALKEMKKRNGEMVLCGLSPSVGKVFKLSGFNTIFEIIPGREEALAKLTAGTT